MTYRFEIQDSDGNMSVPRIYDNLERGYKEFYYPWATGLRIGKPLNEVSDLVDFYGTWEFGVWSALETCHITKIPGT